MMARNCVHDEDWIEVARVLCSVSCSGRATSPLLFL